MNIQSRLLQYINSNGLKLVWIAKKIKELEPDTHFDYNKLSQSLMCKRKMSLDEYGLICKALGVNPEMFMDTG